MSITYGKKNLHKLIRNTETCTSIDVDNSNLNNNTLVKQRENF